MRRLVLLTALLLVGCKPPPHAAKATAQAVTLSGVNFQTIRKQEPGLTDYCIDQFMAGNTSSIPDEKCFKFGKQQRMSGTWAAMFEGSQFCSGEAKSCDADTSRPDTWLAFAEPVKIDWDRYMRGVYAIDFVGRRTTYPGHYGHMGGFAVEVLVDRVISIRQLKAPPKH